MTGRRGGYAKRAMAAGLVALAGVALTATAASAATKVSNVTVTMNAPTTSSGGSTSYVVRFKAASTLSGTHSAFVKVVFPAGTTFGTVTSSLLMDGTTAVGGCAFEGGTTMECFVYSGSTLPAGHVGVANLNGVTNPAPGSYHLTVSTSADTTPVTSPNYTVTAKTALSGISVTMTAPTTSSGGSTSYVVHFKTSATGALAGNAGSFVKVVFPAGTTFGALTSSLLTDGTNAVGGCAFEGGTTLECFVYSGSTLAANHGGIANLNGVTNPKPGTYHLTVSSSSDATPITSPNYTVTPATTVSNVTVAPSSTLTSASNVTYRVGLKLTTSLAGNAGSLVKLVFPGGTGFASFSTSPLFDGATQIGGCSWQGGTSTTVQCYVYTGVVAHAGDSLSAQVTGLKNPAATKAYTMHVSTSSDATVVNNTYCIVAANHPPCITAIAPASGKVGAAVTISGVNLGGATAVKFHGKAATITTDTATKITTKVPTGATTGTITVTTSVATATSTQTFTVLA